MSAPYVRTPGGNRADADENTEKHSDFTVMEQKLRATLIARLALVGFAVHPVDVGGFLVTKWNLSRYCGDLHSLAAFAKQVGAQP